MTRQTLIDQSRDRERRVNLRLNPKKIDTKGFLMDSGRICLPESDIGKGVISKMASKMGVTILQ